MGERASTLFRDRIGHVESLYAAWAAIRANADDNTHTGREFRDVERHLADHIEDLAGRILDGSWSPGPLRRATITDDDGDTRVLRIPPLLDRVVERSIVDALTPILDPTFTPWSFAYRRGLGTSDALAALAALRDDGFRWVLRTDFSDCFDMIDREATLTRLALECADTWLLTTVRALLERCTTGEEASPTKGLPQGGPLSPMLANLLLDTFDRHLIGRGFPLVRYADDLVVAVRSQSSLDEARAATVAAASAVGMSLGEEKTMTTGFDEGFHFLGEDIGPTHPVAELAAVQAGELIKKTLYVTRQGARVVLRQGHFQVRDPANDTVMLTAPVSLVANIVMVGAIGFSAGARSTALYHDIEVSFLSRRGSWLGRLESAGPARARLRRAQYSMAGSDRALRLARAFVRGKIDTQAALLLRYARRSEAPLLTGTAESLRARRRKLARLESCEALMGVEGAAAKEYFNAVGALVPDWTSFRRRQRRPPKDPVNSTLGYAYAVLLGEATSALCTVGLDPVAGFLHSDFESRPSLALDLMEEFRPLIVDTTVVNLFRRSSLTQGDFATDDNGAVLLRAPGKRRLMSALEERLLTVFSHVPSGKRVTYRRALLLQAQQIVRVVEERQDEYEPVMWR